MKKNIRSVFNMLLVLEDFLKSNHSLISAIAGMESETRWFFSNLDTIRQYNTELSQASTHQARSKMEFEKALDTLLLGNSRKISAYAALDKNTALLQTVSITPTNLNRMENNRKVGFASILHDAIQSHLPDLTKYGLSVVTQAALEKAALDYAESIPTVRGTIVRNAGYRSKQTVLVQQTNRRIKEIMDRLVLAIESEQPEFASQYKRCRRQIDLTRSKLSLNGSVVQADGTPISGARIYIGTQTLKSTSKGNFRLLRYPPGIYQLKIGKPGFLPFEQEISIQDPGHTTRIKVVMPAKS